MIVIFVTFKYQAEMKNLDYLEESLVMLEFLVPANYIHCKIEYLPSLHRYGYIINKMFIFSVNF